MNTTIAYIIIGVSALFILGIKFLSSPKTARQGNLVAAAGMFIALCVLLKTDGTSVWSHGWSFNYTLIVIGTVIGLIIGAIGAYSVKMTSMPQMVALFNGLGGGAAALVASLEFVKDSKTPEVLGLTLPVAHQSTAFIAASISRAHSSITALRSSGVTASLLFFDCWAWNIVALRACRAAVIVIRQRRIAIDAERVAHEVERATGLLALVACRVHIKRHIASHDRASFISHQVS